MGRIPFILALALALTAGASQAQETRPNLTEVRFHDGSIVRVTLLQENVEVLTKYGKLTIPLSEIRRIEFGMHTPADVDKRIGQSIKKLGSDAHKERDLAGRDLVNAGHYAFSALLKASKSGDQEVATRASSVIKKISESAPPDLLKVSADDVVTTDGFTVVGRIMSETIRANSVHFGDVDLKLSGLRTAHLRRHREKYEITVDAARNGSTLDQWFDTGCALDKSQRLSVASDGQVDLWPQGPGQYVATPKGYNTAGKGGQYLAGALIGRIGENGKTFLIGDRFEGSATEEGKLYLLIVPSPWNNTSAGNYRVRLETASAAIGAP